MSRRLTGAIVLVVAAATAAHAEPKLRLEREPPPRHLSMRPRAAQTEKPATVSTPPPGPPAAPAPPVASPIPDAALVRTRQQAVQASFNLGYQVDGTALTGRPTLGGQNYRADDFRLIRTYGFAEAYVGTHGFVIPQLSTYLAGKFLFVPKDLGPGGVPVTPPIATWFDESRYVSRNAWGEMHDFLPGRTFAPLRVRIGQQYVYGPWVLHMNGALAGWDTRLVRMSVYAGTRVADYTSVDLEDVALIGGASARVDLRALRKPIPFAIAADVLAFTAAKGAAPSRHAQLEVDWRPRTDLVLIGQARVLDGKVANEHVQFRSRYKQVTNLVFDATFRSNDDWRWDPSLVGPDKLSDPLAPKRYLELGPVLPQMLVSGRAGTLIAENIDLLARGAFAVDLSRGRDIKSSFSASYFELAGGLEVRLRRQVALGLSALTRQTDRDDPLSEQIRDVPGTPQPFPESAAMGERGFAELGTSLRMSLGARKFSATLEIYGRRTRYALDYCVGTKCGSSQNTGVQSTDTRGGGRVMIDAWVSKQVRLFAAYEASSRFDFEPDISGYKSLRLIMEGVY
jgi:hypothetical protein